MKEKAAGGVLHQPPCSTWPAAGGATGGAAAVLELQVANISGRFLPHSTEGACCRQAHL